MSLLGSLSVSLLGNNSNLNSSLNAAQQQVANFGKKMEKVGSDISTIGANMTKLVSLPLLAVGGLSVKAASDFESAFAGMRKTIDATEPEFAAFEKGIRDMAKAGPSTAAELAAIGEAAGQLGIKKSMILDFTSVMSDLGVATNLSSEEAASSLARLANITQMPQEEFKNLGSSIVALGNNFATTEAEIVEMSLRLSGMGSQVGMSEAQIVALSTAMSSVGIQAEAGGSAMSTVMKKINTAVDGGGIHLKEFADMAGVSSKDFADQWKSDPVAALDTFIKGIAKAGDEGDNLAASLGLLGIKGIREQDTLLRLAGASDILSSAVETSTTAWKENTALTNEAAQRYATFESQMATLKNKITDIGITIGQVLLPVILNLVDQAAPLVAMFENWAKKFSELNGSTQIMIITIAAIAAAIGPVLVVVGMLISSVGAIISAFAGLAGVITAAGGVMAILTGPVAIVIAGLALLGVALVALYKNSETFRTTVSNAFESIKSVAMSVFGVVASFVKEQLGSIKTFWDANGAQFLAAVENVFNGIMAVVKFVMPAILFIINMVWTAIKQVISGALNVIMALVKIFSGIFTGNFSLIWEGVKQIFFGAIDLILGLMTLTFVGGIRAALVNLGKIGLGLVRNMTGGITNLFRSLVTQPPAMAQAMVSRVMAFFRSLYTQSVNIFGTLRTFGASIWNAIREVIVAAARAIYNQVKANFQLLLNAIKVVLNSIKAIFNVIKGVFTNFVSTVSSTFGKVYSIITKIWSKVMGYFRGINLVSIGKNIIQGLINGIGSMASEVWAKVRSITDKIPQTIKKIMGIASPSKLTTKLGEYIGQGLVVGMGNMVSPIKNMASVMSTASIPNIPNVDMSLNTTRNSAGTGDGQSVIGDMYGALKSTIILELDGETLGQIVLPHVARGQERESRIKLGALGVNF